MQVSGTEPEIKYGEDEADIFCSISDDDDDDTKTAAPTTTSLDNERQKKCTTLVRNLREQRAKAQPRKENKKRKKQKTVKSSTRNKCKQKTIKIPWNEMTAFGLTTTATMKSQANKWEKQVENGTRAKKKKKKKRKHTTNSLKINTTDEKFLISFDVHVNTWCSAFSEVFFFGFEFYFHFSSSSFRSFSSSLWNEISLTRWNGFSFHQCNARFGVLFLSISILLSFSINVRAYDSQAACVIVFSFFFISFISHWHRHRVRSYESQFKAARIYIHSPSIRTNLPTMSQ